MEENKVIEVREFNANKDIPSVEDIERRCEVGPTGQMSLFTNLLGDPISRIRHSPSFLMLVCVYIYILYCIPSFSLHFYHLSHYLILFPFCFRDGSFFFLFFFFYIYLQITI